MRRLLIIGSIAGLCLAGFAGIASAEEEGSAMKLVNKGRSGAQWVQVEESRAPHALTGRTTERAPDREDRARFQHHGRAGTEFQAR